MVIERNRTERSVERMKNIRDQCIEFFKNEEICKNIREMLKPLVTIVYNELYLYIWAICLFNIFLIIIVLANLYLLFRIIQTNKHL